MTAVLLSAAAVILLDLYAVVLVVLRAKVYRVALYRPMLLNIGLSTLPIIVAIGVWVGLFVLAETLSRLVHLAPEAAQAVLPVYVAVAAAVWLLLFPNSVYLITELNFSHRTTDTPVPLWFDIIQTLALTLSGLANAVLSLGILQVLFATMFPSGAHSSTSEPSALPALGWVSWVFAVSFIVLGAVGVYLGRYLRFNSWDVRHPVSLLRKLAAHLRQPGKSPEAAAFVATHAILVVLLYVPMFSLAWTALSTPPV